jgi:DNA-binding NarL/FixJ family response regulator
MAGVTDRYWEPPDRIVAYDKYVARRDTIIKALAEGKTVKQIAKEMKRSPAAVYTDIAKMLHEANVDNYWSLMIEAIKLEWIPCPLAKPHLHEERPPCPE